MEPGELDQTDEGVLLPVRAQPGARKNEISGWHNGRLKIRVTQIAEKGKANQALIKLLAKSLEIPRSRVELTSGETSREKVFVIKDIPADELLARITAVLPESA